MVMSYFFVVKYKLIKNQDRLFFFIDVIFLLLYFLHVYKNGFEIFYEIIYISLLFFFVFGFFKMLAYFNNNSKKFFIKLGGILGEKASKKIKNFFLKPIVCKFIYYFV